MISAPYPAWPSQSPRQRRAPSAAVFVLISLLGLFAGMLLRPLTQGFATTGGSHTTTISTSSHSVATTLPTISATLPPQLFAFDGVTIAPATVSAGEAVTVTATAKKKTDSLAAQTVTCTLTIEGLTIDSHPEMTNAAGIVSWKITIPAQTPPGGYNVKVSGNWGVNGAWSYGNLMVKN